MYVCICLYLICIYLASYLSCFFFLFFFEFFLFGNNFQEKGDLQSQDKTKDNRALVDNNNAQSLTGEEIDEMRR